MKLEAKNKTDETGKPAFPIVGIGASAGGLEAFSLLLENLRDDLGMAYVFIQHLSPSHESFLTEILERKTKMKVHTVKDDLKVEKNNVYVIPPNYALTITDGTLKLIARQKKERNFSTIDHFFSDLASVYTDNAIGILLSGTGTDGTIGLKDIKGEGGITFAQNESAKFKGMPQNAIEYGCVDFIMSPELIAKELGNIIRKANDGLLTTEELMQANRSALRRIHQILHNKKDVDFSYYKQSTIQRRILRRVNLSRLKGLDAYVALLEENPSEVDALYHDLLINVTSFFREPELYKAINSILPVLLKDRENTEPIRVWVPGCATGEEIISIAILILEYLGNRAVTMPIQLFGTDLNEKGIEKARTGIYSKNAVSNISEKRLKTFFIPVDGKFQISKSIRDICVFAKHNLLQDPPFSRMDIISCQNVLIYLEGTAQIKIMQSFHFGLKPTGYLILGKSESIGGHSDLFNQLGKNDKIYTRRETTTPLMLDIELNPQTLKKHFHSEFNKIESDIHEYDIDRDIDKLLMSRYMPAAVLINKNMDILRFRGSTSKYLEPSPGKASFNIMKMLRDELVFDVKNAFQQVRKNNEPVRTEEIKLKYLNDFYIITIDILAVPSAFKDQNYLILFHDRLLKTTDPPGKNGKKNGGNNKNYQQQLERQTAELRENMKTMSEEFEATREELQSANEEILSSNEELQSINEEMETSKEELQSTNEELTTINEELLLRNDQLKISVEYTDAILNNMHEHLIVLSDNLVVRTANKSFYSTFHLTPPEVEGKLFYDINNSVFNVPALQQNLKSLLTIPAGFCNFELDQNFPLLGRMILEFNVYKYTIRDEKEKQYLFSIRDITDSRLLEEEKDSFVAIASHEIRTPLTSIKTYSQILLDELMQSNNEEAATLISKVDKQIDKLTNLITDFIDVNKIDAGDILLRKDYFSINDLVKEVVSEIQPGLVKHTIEVTMDKNAKVYADRERTAQVITNLLANAIKYSPDSPKIWISTVNTKTHTKVLVKDGGIGIPDHLQPRIFQRFFRATKSETFSGMGLGLYIAAEIVKKQGGEIWVKSKLRKGSEFCFTIPLKTVKRVAVDTKRNQNG